MSIRGGALRVCILLFGAASSGRADVVVRCVDYNITSFDGPTRPGLETVLAAIGRESVAGRVLPPDLIGLEEVQAQATTVQRAVAGLNSIYGTTAYARGSLNGATTGAGTQGIVYNTMKLQLMGEAAVGVSSGSGQPRQTMRYRFRAVGAPAEADFYVYVAHWKALDDPTSEARRGVEADAIRVDAARLGADAAIIYMGDFNVYRSTDTGFQRMILAGAGQGLDPLNRLGAWHNSVEFLGILTQAPAVAPGTGLAGGGLDDRFDWQMVTAPVLGNSGVGLTYLPGSYHTFGNNGSVPLNGNINDPRSTALGGLADRGTVLDLLTTMTDHLPVVADFVIQIRGACCDASSGVCAAVSETVCTGIWASGACLPNPCEVVGGACCRGTVCGIETAASCERAPGGEFQGAGSLCGQAGNPTTCCAANFNGLGGASVQDIFDFLAAYFSNSENADFNHSGAITVQDIFDFLAAYFAGCT